MTVEYSIVHIGCLGMNKFWGETERGRSATATCTLLTAAGVRLLVDPSPQPGLLEPLLFAHTGLRPGDIDLVFVTHFHADHRYGLDLFPQARWLMAEQALADWRAANPDDEVVRERFESAQGALPAGVWLLPTPGHTRGHHSLLARTRWGGLVVAGDAVMTPEFCDAEEGYHNSVDFYQAAETIREIKTAASLIIPGHGNLIINR